MIVTQGSSLMFETDSNDHAAVIVGPGVAQPVQQQQQLPTDKKGFYTLSVIDRQMRKLTVTLKGNLATPPVVSDAGKARVEMTYRVE